MTQNEFALMELSRALKLGYKVEIYDLDITILDKEKTVILRPQGQPVNQEDRDNAPSFDGKKFNSPS